MARGEAEVDPTSTILTLKVAAFLGGLRGSSLRALRLKAFDHMHHRPIRERDDFAQVANVTVGPLQD